MLNGCSLLLLACLVHARRLAVSLGASDVCLKLTLVRNLHLLGLERDWRLLDRLWLNDEPDLVLLTQLCQLLLGLLDGLRILQQMLDLVNTGKSRRGLVELAQLKYVICNER